MDTEEIRKLEHLSLVSKVCTELDNHLGMNDKDLGKSRISENLGDVATRVPMETGKHEKRNMNNWPKVMEFCDSFSHGILPILFCPQLMAICTRSKYVLFWSPLTKKLSSDRENKVCIL